MKDYQPILDYYSDGLVSFLQRKVYSSIPDTMIEYLDKYWLDKQDLENAWLGIKNTIFQGAFRSFPCNNFREDFDKIFLKGGTLFNREYYNQLQSCITQLGDHYFVAVEDVEEDDDEHLASINKQLPPLRFKFPANISFDEMLSGEVVSEELILMFHRCYFVFGDSGQWGIYTNNDAIGPLRIVGFKKQFSDLFNSRIITSEEEKEESKRWFLEDIQEMENWLKTHPE